VKIIVPAIGSRGDVQPYIALCQGLEAAGHQVTLATNPTLIDLARSYGVRSAPVGPPVDMGAEGAKIWARAGRNWWLGLIRTMQLGFRLVKEAYPDLLELVKETDLVIVTDTFAGAAEAERSGVPWISVTLQPARVPVPNPQVSQLIRMFFPMANWFIMAPMNRFRRRVGVSPFKDMGSMLSGRLVLIPVSPCVHPHDPRWPDHVHLTGYWFARSPHEWTPPQDLLEFIEAGGPPIAVSLGAMSLAGEETRQAARMMVAAIRQTGVRAILQGWEQALQGEDLPDSIYHAGSLPHTWLFDRVRAVVHHGGFGTTASALRAGVLALVIPHIIDQLYWAQKVFDLGTGPRFIHRADLEVGRLATALQQAVSDEAILDKAASMGECIRREADGVGKAVQLIEEVL
jgi:sterol 3beta-glucosyltransferase